MEPGAETTPGSWTRLGVAAAVLVGAVWIVGPNLDPGPMRDRLDVVWAPATELGLEQDWRVFSPDPFDRSIDMEARVTFDDGSTAVWRPPDHGPVLGAYREYRWQKWRERVILDARSDLWEPTAVWVAARFAEGPSPVASVALVRRWRDHEPLTAAGITEPAWNEFVYFTWTSG